MFTKHTTCAPFSPLLLTCTLVSRTATHRCSELCDQHKLPLGNDKCFLLLLVKQARRLLTHSSLKRNA